MLRHKLDNELIRKASYIEIPLVRDPTTLPETFAYGFRDADPIRIRIN